MQMLFSVRTGLATGLISAINCEVNSFILKHFHLDILYVNRHPRNKAIMWISVAFCVILTAPHGLYTRSVSGNEPTHLDRVTLVSSLTPQLERHMIDLQFKQKTEISRRTGNHDHESVNQEDDAIRIAQELTLTRDAFSVRLEVDNGESSVLEHIHVEIEIVETHGSSQLVNGRFLVGNPQVHGLSGVDGTGVLARNRSGSSEWLIIPHPIAAPEQDTLYDVTGRLSYRVEGSDFAVQLVSDTITVRPSPNLTMHYFYDKYTQGDTMTSDITSDVPFSIAVMVTNNDKDVARQLQILSEQPIVTTGSDHGLAQCLIIGSQIGASQATPSLTVELDDIGPFETATARWLLNSTSKGEFYNFTATVENPPENAAMMFMDIKTHELVHLARIDLRNNTNDKSDDFLVNDIPDEHSMPDKLYDSENGSIVYDVHSASITNISNTVTDHVAAIEVTVRAFTNHWFYIRFKNNVTSPAAEDNQVLQIAGVSGYGRLLVGKNVWQTNHIEDAFLVHILDYVKGTSEESTEVEMNYEMYYFAENTPPKFNKTVYSKTIPSDSPINTYVMRIQADDIEPGVLEYEIVQSVPFRITTFFGRIYVNGTLPVGVVEFEVVAQDKQIEPKNSSTTVRITCTDEISFYTTKLSSSPATTLPVTSSTSADDSSGAIICGFSFLSAISSLLMLILTI